MLNTCYRHNNIGVLERSSLQLAQRRPAATRKPGRGLNNPRKNGNSLNSVVDIKAE
jgi:hypothetical protein